MKRLFIAALMAALASSAARAADCSGTIGTGGTAQTAIATPAGGQRINGYRVCNLSTSEPLWINPYGTAAAPTPGSFPRWRRPPPMRRQADASTRRRHGRQTMR
jgi:hypothetical protein